MGRKPSNVEFLRTLHELSTHSTNAAFAKACGKTAGNMHNYKNGRPVPKKNFLKSCLINLFEWDVQPLFEVQPVPTVLGALPQSAGIYIIYGSDAQVPYVGKATNFRNEIRQTFNRQIPIGLRLGPSMKRKRPRIGDIAARLSLYAISSKRVRHNLEALLLRVFVNQTHNSNIGEFR